MKFGDKYMVANSVATLRNDIFVFTDLVRTDDKYYYFEDNVKIEKKIMKKSSSPSKLKAEKNCYIIFPYRLRKKDIRYTEEEFKEKYPETFKYLQSKKETLDKRDSDKGSNWFEYGRSQALYHMKGKKILLSSIITNEVKSYQISSTNVPYSGLFIKAISPQYTLDYAQKILQSKDFFDYINRIGIKSEGSSRRITAQDIKKYYFKEDKNGQNSV